MQLTENMRIQFSRYMVKMEYASEVVLANSLNGLWVKLSQECYLILKKCIEEKMTLKYFMYCLSDDEDRQYIKELLQSLSDIEVIVNSDISEKNLPKTFIFEITNHCNLACRHCCFSVDYHEKEEMLSTEQIKVIFDKLICVAPKAIVLSGGEAMHRTDFFELLDFLRSMYNGTIGLMTNGTYINEKNVKELCSKINTLDVSIDGVDENSCALIRGKGVFTKVINAVELCKKQGLEKISLSMVVTKLNRHLIPEFYKLNERLGTIPMLRKFEVTGQGFVNKDLFLEEDQKNEFIVPPKETNILSKAERMEAQRTRRIRTCEACTGVLNIDYKGNMFPCQLLDKKEFILCNLLEMSNQKFVSFINKDIYKTKAFEAFDNIIPEKCKTCSVSYFCITCYARLREIQKQSREYQERYCENMKFDLEQIVWDR